MKHNGSYINPYDLISPEISDDSNHWTGVTPATSDHLKELELERDLFREKQNCLATAKAMIDVHGLEALALMLGQSDAIATCPESEVVFGRSGGRALLIKALEEAQERVIIVCPWLSRKSIDDDMLLKFRAFLDQGDRIDIGWGYSHDVGKIIKISGNGKYFIDAKGDEWQSYSALPRLHLKKTGAGRCPVFLKRGRQLPQVGLPAHGTGSGKTTRANLFAVRFCGIVCSRQQKPGLDTANGFLPKTSRFKVLEVGQ